MTFKGRHALELCLPGKTKEVRKEQEAPCSCTPEHWPQKPISGRSPPEISSRWHLGHSSILVFQQPFLLKKTPSPLHPLGHHSLSPLWPQKETTTFHSWFCIVSKLQNLVIVIPYHLDQLLLHFSYLLSFHHQYNPSDSAKFLLLVSPTYFWLISTSFG